MASRQGRRRKQRQTGSAVGAYAIHMRDAEGQPGQDTSHRDHTHDVDPAKASKRGWQRSSRKSASRHGNALAQAQLQQRSMTTNWVNRAPEAIQFALPTRAKSIPPESETARVGFWQLRQHKVLRDFQDELVPIRLTSTEPSSQSLTYLIIRLTVEDCKYDVDWYVVF